MNIFLENYKNTFKFLVGFMRPISGRMAVEAAVAVLCLVGLGYGEIAFVVYQFIIGGRIADFPFKFYAYVFGFLLMAMNYLLLGKLIFSYEKWKDQRVTVSAGTYFFIFFPFTAYAFILMALVVRG